VQKCPVIYVDAYGLRIVHGEIPGSLGQYGCVISHIFAVSRIEASAHLNEGDEVVEINGIPMAEKSDEQIQLIIGTIREDMELTTRSFSTINHDQVEDLAMVTKPRGYHHGVEFGPVNKWCFDEESWPGPRTGEVLAQKAFEDDRNLLFKGFRSTMAGSSGVAPGSSASGVIQTPWGKIDKVSLQLSGTDINMHSNRSYCFMHKGQFAR
jgi:hypothetical protein